MVAVIDLLRQLFTLPQMIVWVVLSAFKVNCVRPAALGEVDGRPKELTCSLISFHLVVPQVERRPVADW